MKRVLFYFILFCLLLYPFGVEGKTVNLKISGIALSAPGEFGSQFFYLTDSQNFWQIYSYRKTFPEIKKGDIIEVWGEKSETRGLPRLKIKDQNQIKILKNQTIPEPIFSTLKKLKENCGKLVLLEGEVREISGKYFFWTADGRVELISPRSSSKFQVSEKSSITGVPLIIDTQLTIVVFSIDDQEKHLSQKTVEIAPDLIQPEKELRVSKFAIISSSFFGFLFYFFWKLRKKKNF